MRIYSVLNCWCLQNRALGRACASVIKQLEKEIKGSSTCLSTLKQPFGLEVSAENQAESFSFLIPVAFGIGLSSISPDSRAPSASLLLCESWSKSPAGRSPNPFRKLLEINCFFSLFSVIQNAGILLDVEETSDKQMNLLPVTISFKKL